MHPLPKTPTHVDVFRMVVGRFKNKNEMNGVLGHMCAYVG